MLVMVRCLEKDDKEINVCLLSRDTIKHILFSILGYFNLKLKTHRQSGGLYWLFGNMLSDFLKKFAQRVQKTFERERIKSIYHFQKFPSSCYYE